MIEPSADDADLREWFWRCALNLQNAAIKSTPQIAHPCDADHFADDAMRRIDALTEQRISAVVNDLHCFTTKNLCGTDTWAAGWECPCFNCQLWLREKRKTGEIPSLIGIRAADRPAPEGAAPVLLSAADYNYNEQARELGERYIEIDFSKEKADPIEIFVRLVAPALESASVFRDQIEKVMPHWTGAVVAPGPTAGDVERARSIIDDAANIVGGPEAGMLCKDIAVALAAARAAARAELLAQIREPSEELFGPLKDQYGQFGRDELAEFMRALADKLTEAKK